MPLSDRCARFVRAAKTVGALVPALCSLGATGQAALAQSVTWQMLPLFPQRPGTDFDAVDFLRGEGTQADGPAADTIVVVGSYGPFLYNPSGAAGAAGDNGEWGVWHRLCASTQCAAPSDGLVTAGGTILIGSQAGPTKIARGTARGRTWALDVHGAAHGAPLVEPGLPGMVGPTGVPVILAGTAGFDGFTYRTDGDGAPGTWAPGGLAGGAVQTFGVVPPSAALPNGRVLAGVRNGATYSDDGGATYAASSLFSSGRYIVYAFAFVPDPAHPYGGVAYAGATDLSRSPGPAAEVYGSDDGGATWVLAHRFTAAELDLPVFTGQNDVDVHAVSAL